jgi:hypothetical protein
VPRPPAWGQVACLARDDMVSCFLTPRLLAEGLSGMPSAVWSNEAAHLSFPSCTNNSLKALPPQLSIYLFRLRLAPESEQACLPVLPGKPPSVPTAALCGPNAQSTHVVL